MEIFSHTESPVKRISSRNVKRKQESQDPSQPSTTAVRSCSFFCTVMLHYACGVKYLTHNYLFFLLLALLLLEQFLIWISMGLDTKGMFSSAMTLDFLQISFLIMKVNIYTTKT